MEAADGCELEPGCSPTEKSGGYTQSSTGHFAIRLISQSASNRLRTKTGSSLHRNDVVQWELVFMNPKSVLALATGICLLLSGARTETVFTDLERAKITAYWNEPGRYTVSASDEAPTIGPWQVRLTPEASVWFLSYQKAVGANKTPPTVD